MPLLKRKKVTSLPVPAALTSLPDPAEQQRFLESVIDEDAQLASGSSSHGPTNARQGAQVNETSARPYGDPWNDEHEGVTTTRTEEFEGVVLDSFCSKATFHGSSSSHSEIKTWQPLKDSQRLLPSRPSSSMDMDGGEDALVTPENADDKLLDTLLVLKQKQADLLAGQRRTRSHPDVAKRARSGKTDGTMQEADNGANGGEAVYEEMDDPGRYDAAKVPLQLGKWVEPEVYVIAKTGEIFETYE